MNGGSKTGSSYIPPLCCEKERVQLSQAAWRFFTAIFMMFLRDVFEFAFTRGRRKATFSKCVSTRDGLYVCIHIWIYVYV